ncbi:MAG: hypothetical protein AAB594_03215 [Patescibacteria group bacterium]
MKRSKFSLLEKRTRLVFAKYFYKLIKSRRQEMRFRSVAKALDLLRKRSSLIRPNNPRIDAWVDSYFQEAVIGGKTITILTQWCFSKDLEVRRESQGNRFLPTKQERKLFMNDLKEVKGIFNQAGIEVSWLITLNRSYLNSGRLTKEIEIEYEAMLRELARPLEKEGWLMVLNWEDDCLGKRAWPAKEVLGQVSSFIEKKALEREIERHSKWAREEAGIIQTDSELETDVCFQIACEAEEGKILGGSNPVLGDILLAPLEYPERYDFFTLLCPDFKKRIVAVLLPYPWRIDS